MADTSYTDSGLMPEPPPTADELPGDDGLPMETARHREQMNLLIETLDAHWAERDDVCVGGNMFLYISACGAAGTTASSATGSGGSTSTVTCCPPPRSGR